MIDIKELRVGNIVLLNNQEAIVLGVDCVSSFNILIGDDFYGDDEINPIPITTEWLERLGFGKFHRGDWILGLSFFEIEFNNNCGSIYLGCNEYQDGLFHIKYIHQIQNLYFALKGEELKIKGAF